MAGLLDFLSGTPDLSAASQLGVDPQSLAAFKQIQNQAQSAAIGPAIIGGLMSALSGNRRGAGTRALEGAGRAYTSAEQRAEQAPIQTATFAQAQRLADLKQQEGLVTMQKEQQDIAYSQKHGDYLDFVMKNSPNAMVSPDLVKSELSPLLQSQHPAIRQAAQMLAGQELNGNQLNQAVAHLNKAESDANHPGNHIGAVGSAETGYTVYATDPNGQPLGSYRINGTAQQTNDGIPAKVEAKMRQDYNTQMRTQENNRKAKANMQPGIGGTGSVPVLEYPLSYADWKASPEGIASAKANGGADNATYQAYRATRTLPGQVAETIPAASLSAITAKYPEKTPIFVASKNWWVERRGNKLYRITTPLQSKAGGPHSPATMGTKGMGFDPTAGGEDTAGQASPNATPTGETNSTASTDNTPPED